MRRKMQGMAAQLQAIELNPPRHHRGARGPRIPNGNQRHQTLTTEEGPQLPDGRRRRRPPSERTPLGQLGSFSSAYHQLVTPTSPSAFLRSTRAFRAEGPEQAGSRHAEARVSEPNGVDFTCGRDRALASDGGACRNTGRIKFILFKPSLALRAANQLSPL